MRLRNWWSRARGKGETETIVVVSGLPRSGTSMMMRMLGAGGLPPLTDGLRAADDDNPTGYFEFERVKGLDKGDSSWLPEARGKAVKVISALLPHLPSGYRYQVLFMHRDVQEVLASQRRMLANRGEPAGGVSDERLAALFSRHLAEIDAWLSGRAGIEVLDVAYRALVTEPAAHIPRISRFLGRQLDEAAMLEAIDRALYRQRGTGTGEGLESRKASGE